ncbi:uncharacterized protein C8Q71DRAFT_161332 [Rhodofomes roseus]|uniref:Uncharacterized protein n=1 Tax=Rhodofomes roseus TaxID=34475 RepID=A0ABQ8KA19_9APHY|nr:uncharacterized protein C8Q71DRAFT_161332 [Rhodofomes roseus]KAH9834112.1 hypothetical protein C8Q71DRAFT_161332 [Rhodofomes roseus]
MCLVLGEQTAAPFQNDRPSVPVRATRTNLNPRNSLTKILAMTMIILLSFYWRPLSVPGNVLWHIPSDISARWPYSTRMHGVQPTAQRRDRRTTSNGAKLECCSRRRGTASPTCPSSNLADIHKRPPDLSPTLTALFPSASSRWSTFTSPCPARHLYSVLGGLLVVSRHGLRRSRHARIEKRRPPWWRLIHRAYILVLACHTRG